MKMKFDLKRRVLTGVMVASALSTTFKPDEPNIHKDEFSTKKEMTVINNEDGYLSKLNEFFKNDLDTIKAQTMAYRTLDSLINELSFLEPDLKAPKVYTWNNMDAFEDEKLTSMINDAKNRPFMRSEEKVDEILDTVSNYTAVVDREFIKASIREESGYDIFAVSDVGARGLMQVMEDTWQHFGRGSFDNAFNPNKNIRTGIRYYLWMEREFAKNNDNWKNLSIDKKRDLLASAYNGGPYRLMDKKTNWDVKMMPAESVKHAEKVNGAVRDLRKEDLLMKIAYYQDKIKGYDPIVGNILYALNLPDHFGI